MKTNDSSHKHVIERKQSFQKNMNAQNIDQPKIDQSINKKSQETNQINE